MMMQPHAQAFKTITLMELFTAIREIIKGNNVRVSWNGKEFGSLPAQALLERCCSKSVAAQVIGIFTKMPIAEGSDINISIGNNVAVASVIYPEDLGEHAADFRVRVSLMTDRGMESYCLKNPPPIIIQIENTPGAQIKIESAFAAKNICGKAAGSGNKAELISSPSAS